MLNGRVLLFGGYDCMAAVGRTVARPDVLAQTTQSRQGETCRNRSELALDLSLKQRALILSETPSRSGERGSPKRGRVGA